MELTGQVRDGLSLLGRTPDEESSGRGTFHDGRIYWVVPRSETKVSRRLVWGQIEGVVGEESGAVGLTPRSEPSETALRLWRETVVCALGERGETGVGDLQGSPGFSGRS